MLVSLIENDPERQVEEDEESEESYTEEEYLKEDQPEEVNPDRLEESNPEAGGIDYDPFTDDEAGPSPSPQREQERSKAKRRKCEKLFSLECSFCQRLYRSQLRPKENFSAQISGDSVQEVVANMWESGKSLIKREVRFENGVPKWASGEIPGEESAEKFLIVYDVTAHKSYATTNLTSKMLQKWRDQIVKVFVYAYSKEVETKVNGGVARLCQQKVGTVATSHPDFALDNIVSLHTCTLYTVALTESGVLSLGQRKRLWDKAGYTELQRIGIGRRAQVCVKNSPTYNHGAIGFPISHGVLKRFHLRGGGSIQIGGVLKVNGDAAVKFPLLVPRNRYRRGTEFSPASPGCRHAKRLSQKPSTPKKLAQKVSLTTCPDVAPADRRPRSARDRRWRRTPDRREAAEAQRHCQEPALVILRGKVEAAGQHSHQRTRTTFRWPPTATAGPEPRPAGQPRAPANKNHVPLAADRNRR
ncbi:hypothetical protein pipiens_014781 [Culex pipiens pipiens]|uniref:Uncharacterized protein n=1 Tax=Culex pipiens pipiens TaxID=38569 RepID=A0ABD1CT54_CULPP